MLTWPHAATDWAPMLPAAEKTFADIAREISRRQPLLIVCHDASHRTHVRQQLRDNGSNPDKLRWAIAPSNDSWTRDHGPIGVLQDGRPLLLDFRFTGWGGKYPAELDDRISRRLHADRVFGATPMETPGLTLEGGAIDSDGRGTLLTTRGCVANPNRNPGLSAEAIEQALMDTLGLQRVLWLEHGQLIGDDTDGHVDTLARFCDADTIAHVSCDDPADPHHAGLADMAAQLATFRTAAQRPYRLIPLPLPAPRFNRQGQRLPATYANFLIINGAVLMPSYDDPGDALAKRALQHAFPRREIVTIDCRALIEQFGSLHCVTMQLPRGVLA